MDDHPENWKVFSPASVVERKKKIGRLGRLEVLRSLGGLLGKAVVKLKTSASPEQETKDFFILHNNTTKYLV